MKVPEPASEKSEPPVRLKYRSDVGWDAKFKGYFFKVIVIPPAEDNRNFRVWCRNFDLPITSALTQARAEYLMEQAVTAHITDLVSRKPPERIHFAELSWHMPIGSQQKFLFAKAPPETKD